MPGGNCCTRRHTRRGPSRAHRRAGCRCCRRQPCADRRRSASPPPAGSWSSCHRCRSRPGSVAAHRAGPAPTGRRARSRSARARRGGVRRRSRRASRAHQVPATRDRSRRRVRRSRRGVESNSTPRSAAMARLASSTWSSTTTTSCPRRARARTVDVPVTASPYTRDRTIIRRDPGEVADEDGQRRGDADRGDQPEADDHRRLRPTDELEVMVYRRHPEQPPRAPRDLEHAHLHGHRAGLHHVDPADQHQEQVGVERQREQSQRRSDGERADVAHDDPRRSHVQPEEAAARAGERGGEHREVEWVDDLGVDLGVTERPVGDDRGREERQQRRRPRPTRRGRRSR